MNLTADTYLVHGEYGRLDGDGLYGAVVLEVAQVDGKEGEAAHWGYAFAAAMKNWNFASISAPLAIVDTVLSVDKADAAVALSSLDDDAGQDITRYIPAIGQDFKVLKGLNFYARLTFTNGLMTQVAALLNVTAKGPFTVQGYIPAESGTSKFGASLGNLTLLGVLSFDDLVMTYLVDEGRTLTLTGTIGLYIGPSAFNFHGGMVVDEAHAAFTIEQTPQEVMNPLGIPGITLSGLGMDFDYIFATETVPAVWTMDVHGATSIGPVALTGRVVFKDGAAVVSVVELSKPVSIDDIFTQMIGTAWPTGLLAITFLDGKIWYAPTQVEVDDQTWDDGLNASTTVN
ncbi:MAG: hypothetical protein K2X44_00835, partial [Magnetospirillum sp.]|nr:hypothetical protein [Magnetospirillum sp.]